MHFSCCSGGGGEHIHIYVYIYICMRIGPNLLYLQTSYRVGPYRCSACLVSVCVSVQGLPPSVLVLSSRCQLIMSTPYVPKSSVGIVGYPHLSVYMYINLCRYKYKSRHNIEILTYTCRHKSLKITKEHIHTCISYISSIYVCTDR